MKKLTVLACAAMLSMGAQNWQAHKAMVPAEGLKALSLK